MDDDLARAIALSIESSYARPSDQDSDLELALRLSKEMSESSSNSGPGPGQLSKKRKGSELVEVLSSDDEDIDPDLKLAIEISKENKGKSQQNVLYDLEQTISLIDEDKQLALQLQKQLNNEVVIPMSNPVSIQEKHLCSSEWETIDPNPDIHSLFVQFDKRFFWSSLGSVELEWSKRMYTCAGICYYQKYDSSIINDS
jgi:hypothetical protein